MSAQASPVDVVRPIMLCGIRYLLIDLDIGVARDTRPLSAWLVLRRRAGRSALGLSLFSLSMATPGCCNA
jgi:hypothetical protein